MPHPIRFRVVLSAASSFLLIPALSLKPGAAYANCVTAGATTTCDTSAPTPWTGTIGAGPGTASGAVIILNPNAQVVVGNANAISLGDNAGISLHPGSIVQSISTNAGGLYGTGADTVEFRNGNTLIVDPGAQILATGTQRNAEAVNPEGSGNLIINGGTIKATNAAAIWFEAMSGSNTIENDATGIIQAPGNVIGSSGNGAVDFTNKGQVIGNLVFAGGDDTLRLYTGSVITGNFDGGGGNNTIYLNGTGSASLPGNMSNFSSLYKADSGTWTLTGTITGVTVAEVQQGTLVLTGNNSAYTGKVIVDAAGTLEARAQSLPPAVTDNGLVRFAQPDDGSYAGLIAGSGAVEKTQGGTLTLAPAAAGGNTYSGGTTITGGTVAVGADNALGAATGGLTFNGGTLQLQQSFDLAASRALTLNGPGGTIDTQGFSSTLAQGMSGPGTFTKAGTGLLTLTGANTYSGGTTVAAGTLAVGDASHAGAALSGGGNTSVAAGATLGGYGSVTGAVTNSGTIAVANALPQFAGFGNGAFTINGQLTNAGLAQVGGQGVGNQLVVGSYIGQNGSIGLNTYLAGDGAPSDRLVINGGSASGASSLRIANIGGPGALTSADGIQVIQASNGATTDASAFTLAAPVKAGAYSYYLARGGVTGGSAENWYLRNTVAAASGTPDTPIPAAGTPPLPAAPAAGSDPIPLYRPEVPIYAAIPAVARQVGIQQIDNFHQRQGEQALLTENGRLPAAWGRVWGVDSKQRQQGGVSPEFDGAMAGMQVGHDIYADTGASGERNHYGLFFGLVRATGDVNGFALGMPNLGVGRLAIDAYSLGGYWTHAGPGGWYTDAVLMASSLTVDPRSHDGVGATTHGNAVSGSIEAGLPIPLGANLSIEPQAQLLWQKLSINDLNDGVSTVSFNHGNSFLGRLGVRLQGRFDTAAATWQPYLRASVLHSFGSSDSTTFGGATAISTSVDQAAGQLDAGLTATISKASSAFVTASYTANLGGARQRTVMGNAGVRWSW